MDDSSWETKQTKTIVFIVVLCCTCQRRHFAPPYFESISAGGKMFLRQPRFNFNFY